jgi:predicted nucleic-acid-binding Zn-ribbon protein
MLNWFSLLKRDRSKPASSICKKCGSTSLKRRVTTYPVHLTGKLAGKRIDVYRVELDQCRKCGYLMPTPEGRAKVKRCVKRGKEVFLNNLR